jgi:adenosine deaminase
MDFATPPAHTVPVEVCLTSNVISRTVASFADHHVAALLRHEHPCVLCTDDKGLSPELDPRPRSHCPPPTASRSGVFGTTLSREYALAAQHLGVPRVALAALALAGMRHAFVAPDAREHLEMKFKQKLQQLGFP